MSQHIARSTSIEQRLEALTALREEMLSPGEYTEAVITRASYENAWYDRDHILRMMRSLAENMLAPQHLQDVIDKYAIDDKILAADVGIVMAGNLPLVGFHDWLCVYLMGYTAQVKLSSKDPYLLPALTKFLASIDSDLEHQTRYVDTLSDYHAVIATGSENTNRYFRQYFQRVPHLLRSSRTSVAVLSGEESDEEIIALSDDILAFYGLGCRNVSKVYWPEGWDQDRLFELSRAHKHVASNSKYMDNYDYNFAMWGLNRQTFFTNGILLFKPDESLHSRLASIYYETYADRDSLISDLVERADDLQCFVAQEDYSKGALQHVVYGRTQQPSILDYPDGVDIMHFLLSIDG